MRNDLRVTYETFYYFNLLDKIKELGNENYQKPLLNDLERFIKVLQSSDDALSSIEKLVAFSGTSDLSIFFSDIVDHLHRIHPEKAIKEVDTYAQDFLEIFKVLIQSEELRLDLDKITGVEPSPSDELSFDEYCNYIIKSKLEKRAQELAAEYQDTFSEFLTAASKAPDLAQSLHQEIDSSKTREFAEVNNSLVAGIQLKDNVHSFIDSFENTVDKWLALFEDILKENAEEIKDILYQEGISIPKEAEDVEQLLEEVEQESAAAGEVEDIDELVNRAEHLRRRTQSNALTKEEKERRELLQDYIIGEVSSYGDEFQSLLKKLSESNDDIQSENKLLENLKFFKDLGQIHSYSGIELVGKNLLKFFEGVFKSQQEVSSQILDGVQDVFETLPDYIRSSVVAEDKKQISKIESRLSHLSSIIGEEDQISIRHEETLKVTFHEVMARRIKSIKMKLDKYPLQNWSRQEIAGFSSALHNMIFWSNALKLSHVANAIKLLKQVLLSPASESLTAPDLAKVNEFLEFMGEEYSSAGEQVWISSTERLRRILSASEEVSVENAYTAFEEVTLRQIQQIISGIEASRIQTKALFSEGAPTFFRQLNSNALLAGNDSLQDSTQRISDVLQEIKPHAAEIESREGEKFKERLSQILQQQQAADILEFEDLLKYLQDLNEQLTAPTEEITTELETEETQDASRESEIEDEEIQTVFAEEALKYLENIEANVSELMEQDDEKNWQNLELTIHTLKGSAQMTNKKEVAKITILLQDTVRYVKEGNIPKVPETFNTIRDLIAAIRNMVEDTSSYSEEKEEQFRHAIEKLKQPAEQEALEETPEPEERDFLASDELVEEKTDTEVIELLEQDPEIIQIFKDEVSSNIQTIEKNLDNIEKFAYDKGLMQEVDRSVHEINSAAKMLGLSEIGDLSEKLEQMVDLIYKQKITNVKQFAPVMRRSMLVVRELAHERKIERQFYDEVNGEIDSILQDESTEESEPEQPLEESSSTEEPETSTSQVWEAFFQEAVELIDDLNYLILELEKSPDSTELRHHMMRSLHTLKGSAAMVNAHKIESLAHLSESALEKFSTENLPLDTQIFDLFFNIIDEIKYILNALKTVQREETQKFDEINEQLNKYIDGENGELTPKDTETIPPPVQEIEAPNKEKPQAKIRQLPQTEQTYIRLNIAQMNHLLNLAAELVISHTQFKNQLERLKNISPALDSELKMFDETKEHLDSILKLEQRIQDTLTPINEIQPGVKESVKNQLVNIEKILSKFQAFQDEIDTVAHLVKDNASTYDENIEKLNKLSNELLDEIIQARLVPIHVLFKRFQRPVRDIAHQFDKKINLVIKGEDTELDRSLVEELYNPLIHIIRNAIDHGLEDAGEREEVGKDPEGLLEIKASRDRNQVNIEVRDDGKGIDLESIKKLALEKEFATKESLEDMSEQDLFEFLFFPGFSSLPEATLVSGRGVGLDAVKSDIERIKGDIRVYSEKGKGTTFVLRVPISLSVIQSMLVEVAGHTYSIPLNQVEETLNIGLKQMIKRRDAYYLQYKTKEIPLVFLSRLLVLKEETPPGTSAMPSKNPVIITFDRGNHIGLLVDKIVRREEILIKSLGPSLKRLRYIIGGSIMADGKVVLVLDIPQIIQDSLKIQASAPQPETTQEPKAADESSTKKESAKKKKASKKIIEGRKPTILIVDDSLSVRKYLSGLLSQKGYSIDSAKNGYEALNMLRSNEYDLIITDLEMPQISGYELIESVRLEENLQDVPIIVLTGRASENFRNLTMKLGADTYIIKPFKDQELFDEVEKFISRAKK